jgi:tetratricopeptide (TPR) repeat protein
MSTNRLHVIAAALAASLFAGETTAAAQQAGAATGQRRAARPRRVRDALSGEALGAFDRGSTLFEDADFAGARAEFEHAYDLAGEPRILYNVAVCDKMLHKYTRAIDSLERSLREGGKQLPAEYVNRTKETIATLAPYVSKIVITADQQGASVLIDGEPVGSTPIDGPIAIEVGEHDEVEFESLGLVDRHHPDRRRHRIGHARAPALCDEGSRADEASA